MELTCRPTGRAKPHSRPDGGHRGPIVFTVHPVGLWSAHPRDKLSLRRSPQCVPVPCSYRGLHVVSCIPWEQLLPMRTLCSSSGRTALTGLERAVPAGEWLQLGSLRNPHRRQLCERNEPYWPRDAAVTSCSSARAPRKRLRQRLCSTQECPAAPLPTWKDATDIAGTNSPLLLSVVCSKLANRQMLRQ